MTGRCAVEAVRREAYLAANRYVQRTYVIVAKQRSRRSARTGPEHAGRASEHRAANRYVQRTYVVVTGRFNGTPAEADRIPAVIAERAERGPADLIPAVVPESDAARRANVIPAVFAPCGGVPTKRHPRPPWVSFKAAPRPGGTDSRSRVSSPTHVGIGVERIEQIAPSAVRTYIVRTDSRSRVSGPTCVDFEVEFVEQLASSPARTYIVRTDSGSMSAGAGLERAGAEMRP
jgi:hypothetical protein